VQVIAVFGSDLDLWGSRSRPEPLNRVFGTLRRCGMTLLCVSRSLSVVPPVV
jgi:hypothetical protein